MKNVPKKVTIKKLSVDNKLSSIDTCCPPVKNIKQLKRTINHVIQNNFNYKDQRISKLVKPHKGQNPETKIY
jgi:hypothetical protein